MYTMPGSEPRSYVSHAGDCCGEARFDIDPADRSDDRSRKQCEKIGYDERNCRIHDFVFQNVSVNTHTHDGIGMLL